MQENRLCYQQYLQPIPRLRNYPFTTLVPNLGIVLYRDNKSFAMADIPGIIEERQKGRLRLAFSSTH